MSDLIVDPAEARRIAIADTVPMSGPIDAEDDAGLLLAVVRMAASRLCPCSRTQLKAACKTSLTGVLSPESVSPERVDDAIEDLLGVGDLIKSPAEDDGRLAIILSPPMYIRTEGGGVYVIGGCSEGELPFFERVRHHGAYRELVPAPPDDELLDRDMYPFPMDSWMATPTATSPSGLLDALAAALAAAQPSGDIGEAEILDGTRPTTFYPRRWRPVVGQSGRFLARRRNRWGARTWGLVDLASGQAVRWLPLPALDRRFRGCDQAWQVIYAMDAVAGKPQSVSIGKASNITSRLAFGVPLPIWAERRLLLSGRPSAEARSVVAFEIPSEHLEEAVGFLRSSLWIEPTATDARDPA